MALDIEPYLVEFAKPFYEKAKVANKIDFRIGDAIKTLDELEAAGESFDMVFIDADKGGYANYYDRIMSSKSLLKPDGLIVAVSRAATGCCRLLIKWRTGQYDLQSVHVRAARGFRRRRESSWRLQSKGQRRPAL